MIEIRHPITPANEKKKRLHSVRDGYDYVLKVNPKQGTQTTTTNVVRHQVSR